MIAGFSSVGGLWTAFSGIFAIIFGASMLHTFYGQWRLLKLKDVFDARALGSKPLSIFGIAHQFQAETMKKEALRLYPNILEENHVLEKRGLLSLLRDHLIDLSFLEDTQDNPSILFDSRIKGVDEERVVVEKISRVAGIHSHETDSPEIPSGNAATLNNVISP